MNLDIPIDKALEKSAPPVVGAEKIGSSREGRDIVGYRFGSGDHHVSLIGGCHADEPVGPAMLDRLAALLADSAAEDPLLTRLRWWIVPHVNPDGEARNEAWSREVRAHHPDPDQGKTEYDLAAYLSCAVRELPGDDVEFGFPRSENDREARPENLAVADFIRPGAPFLLHGSFHGMAHAAGPWFLIEAGWAERTSQMRDRLRRRVRDLGYVPHDIDRRGEKGFYRIDEGFTTRPDSRAMAEYFKSLDDEETARLFRPSSMEFVRSLGGDPLTLVSEMPLFLLGAEHYREGNLISPPILQSLHAQADAEAVRRRAREIDISAMPIEDQMQLQLAFLEEALNAAMSSGN